MQIHFIDVRSDVESVSNIPSDITPYGTLKNMESQVLNLPSGHQFPLNADNRKFRRKWLSDFVWLEYSALRNAVYCYACRQFSSTNEKNVVFKHTGFSHWKSALDSNKGLKKHQSCAMHLASMAKWAEAIERQKTNASVIEVASGNVLQYRRNYMKKIVEVRISIYKLIQRFQCSFATVY